MTDARAHAPEGTFRLTYRSRDLISATDRRVGLGEIFSTARSNNREQDITGALLITEGYFVQTLEGEQAAVRALFDRISKDPRHDSVSLLDSRLVEERVFSRWAMAKVAEDGEPDIPLINSKRGATPAASRGATPEQERVLQLMRDAAREVETPAPTS
jgi:hypothetical protein